MDRPGAGERRNGGAAVQYQGSRQRTARAARLSRRTALQTAGFAGAAAFLAACSGSSNNKSGGAPAGAPTSAGVSTASAAPPAVQTTPGVKATFAPTPSGPGKLGGTLREATLVQAPHFSPFHPGADPSFVNQWRRVYGYYEHLWNYKFIKARIRVTC